MTIGSDSYSMRPASLSFTLSLRQSSMKLLYRASRDGFRSTDFLNKCANQGATLTIVKVNDTHTAPFDASTRLAQGV